MARPRVLLEVQRLSAAACVQYPTKYSDPMVGSLDAAAGSLDPTVGSLDPAAGSLDPTPSYIYTPPLPQACPRQAVSSY